jgi:tetratricopeptide (TPR) repeat protein
VVHTGYGDREEHRRKALRNLPMILGALESVPGDPSLRMSLGDTYAVLDNRSAARAAYRSICSDEELYPTNPDIFVQAHVNIALMYLREGNDHEAERYLYRTLYIDPARIEAWFHLGAIAQKRGNEERALALFLRCARTAAPLRMTAVNNHAVRLEAIARIGELLPKAHRYAEAEKVLHEAIRVYPGAYRLHSLLGRVYLDQARLRDAAVWFTRSLALEGGRNRAAYEGMARIYELLGDGAQAGQYRRRAATSPAGPTRSLSEGHPAPI